MSHEQYLGRGEDLSEILCGPQGSLWAAAAETAFPVGAVGLQSAEIGL